MDFDLENGTTPPPLKRRKSSSPAVVPSRKRPLVDDDDPSNPSWMAVLTTEGKTGWKDRAELEVDDKTRKQHARAAAIIKSKKKRKLASAIDLTDEVDPDEDDSD